MIDWTARATYISTRHGVSVAEAGEALADPDRVVIAPDYNSATGASIRVIGYSVAARSLLSVILVESENVTYGANAWRSNSRDRAIYREGRMT